MPTDEPATTQSLTRRGYLATAGLVLGAGCSQFEDTESETSNQPVRQASPATAASDRQPAPTLSEAWRVGRLGHVMATTEHGIFASVEGAEARRIVRISEDGDRVWQTDTPTNLMHTATGDDRLFGGNLDYGTIYALDQGDGALVWEQTVDGTLPPYVATNGRALAVAILRPVDGGQDRGYLHLLGTRDGEFQRTVAVPEPPESVKLRNETVVYQGNEGLFAYHITSGEQRWAAPEARWRGPFRPSVIAYPNADGELTGLDPESGTRRWLTAIDSPVPVNYIHTDSTDGLLALTGRATSSKSHLHVFTQTGQHQWSKELGAISGLELRDGLCFVLHRRLDVFAAATGQRVATVDPDVGTIDMAVTDLHVLVGDDELVAYRRPDV